MSFFVLYKRITITTAFSKVKWGNHRTLHLFRRNQKSCENMTVIGFKTLESNMPEMELDIDLCISQLYLLDIMNSVCTEMWSDSLKQRNPGKISHAYWHITGNRIILLNVVSKSPTSSLKALTECIMKVYAFM